METGEDLLQKAALDGSLEYSAWPDLLLPAVLARIEKAARTEFPIPNIPSPHPPARPPSPRLLAPLPSSDPFDGPDQADPPSATSSQGTDKENADPSLPSAAPNHAPAPLPKPVADMLEEILSVLHTNFAQYPPHTIQRLAELVLRPRQHYRNLVPYLHALDRVVHVTSGANAYPLPPALPDVGAMSLLANGVGGGGAGSLSIDTAAANNLGSDEALGGALLTPIPWLSRRANGGGSEDGSDAGSSSPLSASGNPSQFQLQQQQRHGAAAQLEGRVRTESTETIEGPNGMGSIETVSVSVNGIPSTGAGVALLTQRSVTQGELLRQEQRAGLVPLNQLSRQQQQQQQQRQSAQADEDATMSDDAAPTPEEDDDEIPHAGGPPEIGAADTGPQDAATASYIASGGSAGGGGQAMDVQGLGVDAAVGRSSSSRLQSPPSTTAQQQQQQESRKRASGSPEDRVPRSPKREAGDALELESPRKRLREGECGSGPGQQSAETAAGGDTVMADDDDGDNNNTGAADAGLGTDVDTVLPDAAAPAVDDAPEADTAEQKQPQEAAGATADEPAAASTDSATTRGEAGVDDNAGKEGEQDGQSAGRDSEKKDDDDATSASIAGTAAGGGDGGDADAESQGG